MLKYGQAPPTPVPARFPTRFRLFSPSFPRLLATCHVMQLSTCRRKDYKLYVGWRQASEALYRDHTTPAAIPEDHYICTCHQEVANDGLSPSYDSHGRDADHFFSDLQVTNSDPRCYNTPQQGSCPMPRWSVYGHCCLQQGPDVGFSIDCN